MPKTTPIADQRRVLQALDDLYGEDVSYLLLRRKGDRIKIEKLSLPTRSTTVQAGTLQLVDT